MKGRRLTSDGVNGRPENDAPCDLLVEGDVFVESIVAQPSIEATESQVVVKAGR